MIKTQRQRSFGHRLKRICRPIPRRHHSCRAQPQDQTLLRQRNRSGPLQPKGPVIRHHRHRSTRRFRRQLARLRLPHSLRIKPDQIVQPRLIHLPQNGHQHPIIRLHRKSNINRARMDNTISHQSPRGQAVFPQRHPQSADRIKRRSWLLRMLFSMGHQRIHPCRSPHRGQRSRPTPTHRIRHRHPHRRCWGQFLLF